MEDEEGGGRPGILVIHERPGVVVMVLAGEHDNFTAPKLSARLAEELARGSSIVVDLQNVDFLDSTTAGALLVADQRATTAGRRLVLVLDADSAGPVQRLFETARLRTILTVVPTLEAALALADPPLQSEE